MFLSNLKLFFLIISIFMSTFKKAFSLEERHTEATKILKKYSDRIPIIVSLHENSTLVLDKKKFLVPVDLTIGQFKYVIRKRLNILPDKGIFFFCNKKIPAASDLMSDLYKNNKDTDLFLYMTISEESVFG